MFLLFHIGILFENTFIIITRIIAVTIKNSKRQDGSLISSFCAEDNPGELPFSGAALLRGFYGFTFE